MDILWCLMLAREKNVYVQRDMIADVADELRLQRGICCLCGRVLGNPSPVLCGGEADPLRALPASLAPYRELARVYSATTKSGSHRAARALAELQAVCGSRHTDLVELVAACMADSPADIALLSPGVVAGDTDVSWEGMLACYGETFVVPARTPRLCLAQVFVAAALRKHTVRICGYHCTFLSLVTNRITALNTPRLQSTLPLPLPCSLPPRAALNPP
jgi:hypothetical protein